MEFYEVVNKRRTIRDFEGKEVPLDALERIIEAGLKAPTNDHLRQWEFVVLRGKEHIASVLSQVSENAALQLQAVNASNMGDCARAMYIDGVPKQYRMLSDSGCLLLPFYRQRGELLHPENQSALNDFASIWCCIENMLLAATAEGLACSLRIPIGNEQQHVASLVHAPKEYVLPCYIGIGYPAVGAALVKQPDICAKDKIHFDQW